MTTSIRILLGGLALAVAALGPVQAQQAAPAQAPAAPAAEAPAAKNGPPAGFVAPAEPRADESNAERNKSQPGNNAPVWRAVRETGGLTSLPGAEKGVLIQPFVQYPGSKFTTAGEAWRQVRNQWILPYGGSLLLIVVVAMGLFYRAKGTLGGHEPDTGRKIERFTPLERAAHWTNAIAFVALAVSGVIMAWGKFFLLPILGGTLFGWLTYALKNLHNFAGPLFAVSLVIVLVTFIKDNWPSADDWKWIKSAGGLFGAEEVPSHRFNAGEKIVFWGGVLVLGFIVVASGLVLNMLVPGMAYLRSDMQIAHMVHAVAGVLMMAMFLGHIYMGTIGMKGAYSAMRTGYVDEGWAKEHHRLWYDDVRAGRIPAQRSGQAAPLGAPASGHAD
ncbi:formate dehydrogenase subunit gamma [Rubrivivax rivuli]|uniref:Formate dehydrogenase subunit gamma n=1 Tax=Rubrivivax rivuli TaxID=1862385 RepID=A0A437RI21_9BURK|nr:formate dehydrogenase subunit gamma [Rubrivivax rivuli]RVU46355.1 formate dehydrogenase subunit gamma [Rubrivivax rivuli]